MMLFSCKLIKSCVFSLAVFVLLPCSQANAVSLSTTGKGQALIIPYYGNLGGNQTLLTITSGGGSRALKVLFHDRQGEVKLSFNLYLGSTDSWTASIARVNGESRLYVPDNSCTLPELVDERGYVKKGLTSGYIEIIDMGHQGAVIATDCNRLASTWEIGGKWQQDGDYGMHVADSNLSAKVAIINVAQGTLYSIDAVALIDFSDVPQHTAPGVNIPNLSTPHDSGTATGETRSRVCDTDGCLEDTWTRPIDAVAAVLSTFSFRGDYSSLWEIKAETELLLTFPLLPYYRQLPEEIDTASQISISPRAADGDYPRAPGPGDPPPPYSFSREIVNTIEIASFSDVSTDYATERRSRILKELYKVFMPDTTIISIYNHGSMFVYLSNFKIPNYDAHPLVSNSGRLYVGLPALAYTLQRFLNNQLINQEGDRVQANYANTFKLSRDIRTFEPETAQN